MIALGEIRTPAEAPLAVHAAHTGRLVTFARHTGAGDTPYRPES